MKKIVSIISVLMSLCVIMVFGQERNLEVSGTVYDAALNDPLPGVSIFIKNAPGVGTTTDANGKFTIRAAHNEIIVFQMIGMATVEKLVTQRESDVRVDLKEDTQLLDEVVITGLTAQKKVSIVGAITSVNVDELKTPATSLNNMLGGRVAGIMTSMISGEPGKNISNFWIRGIGTFGANSGALVLIDGLEGRLQDVDPDDVQSFQILKDAAATAVYGVRGANGVVIVTTKRGHSGKLKIQARGTLQVNQLKRLPKYLNAYDYAKLANEARALSGENDIYTRLDLDVIQSGLDPDIYPNVDWMNEIMKKTSLQHRYYMSAQGGGDVAQYFVSLGAKFENAAYNQADVKFKKPVNYNQITYRTNIDMNLTPKTKLYFGTEGSIIKHTLPGMENTNSL
ncbi:MAG TPA: SusC/RagA family TonB-linked outer membrane protein, partial [Petrimonas sp.]|nr:SusC/RagA family TonB-linked outer membrane protein [Petrimonas sp.]